MSQPGEGLRPGYLQIWADAAKALDAEAVDLTGGFIEIRKGGSHTRVWNHWVALDDIVTMRLSLDKTLVHGLVEHAGLPVPDHVEFAARDLSPAIRFLEERQRPCVIKPVTAAGGSGITTGIRTVAQLRRACLRASRLDRRLLLECQVPGDVYRVLVLDGVVIDVVRRDPPSVVGDGRSRIGDLIAAENVRRAAGGRGGVPAMLRADLDCAFTLEAARLTLDSVPDAGQRIVVKTAVSQNGPGENESVVGQGTLSSELMEEAASAARVTDLRLAGVDIITPDPGTSLAAAGGVILEVNGSPGLHYHYQIRNPKQGVPVAALILGKIFG